LSGPICSCGRSAPGGRRPWLAFYWSETAKGKVFEVRHPHNAEGKRLYEVVGPRLDEAKARAREIHGDATPRVSSVGLTLNDVVEAWKEVRQVRPRSEESYDAHLRLYLVPRFGRVKIRDIQRDDITAWLNGLQGKRGPLSSGTKRMIFSTLRVVLDHAVYMGALGVNPVKQIRTKDRPKPSESRRRVLNPDEEMRLLAHCEPFPWLRPIITVALYQALRLGEVLGLQWGDVDFASRKLTVRHSLAPDKTARPDEGREVSDDHAD
jgi:integrase